MLIRALVQVLKEANPAYGDRYASLLTVPKSDQADICIPCFQLREGAESPSQAADRIAIELGSDPVLQKRGVEVIAVGPYVNFLLTSLFLAHILRAPNAHVSNNKTLVLDYSSPNIGKPFGIGHLRSTVIGASIKATHEYLGWNVIGINHIGDWGTQFGKQIVAYRRWGENNPLNENAVEFLYQLYVKFHKEAETDPTLEDEGREWFAKLERGDAEARSLWTLFRQKSLEEFEKIYGELAVSFDYVYGESFYEDKMSAVVDELKKKNLLTLDDGAWIVDFAAHNIPDLTSAIITKTNGTTTYILRDVTSLLFRYRTFHFDLALYEVGAEQSLHFKQVFAIARLLGYNLQCEHVSHGLYVFPEGKMSTRKGSIIFIDDVLDETIKKAEQIIAEKNPELADKRAAAKKVARAALVFQDLRADRVKTVTFSWEKMLDFEGETGPYVQYGYARIASILRKANAEPKEFVMQLREPEELALAKHVLRFDEHVERAAVERKPHILCRYILDLVQLFNSFYVKHKVLHEDQMIQADRLALITIVRKTLAQCAQLLRIPLLEEM